MTRSDVLGERSVRGAVMPLSLVPPSLVAGVLAWFGEHARALPWRATSTTPWGVLVSEVMLQQTPVARVEPVWTEWMARWPEPADLAGASRADAVRAWGRLGYPRRAVRLHECATVIAERHGGTVPAEVEVLRSLPGVGEYTSAAVAAFAYQRRHAVLDTNVRRVLARAVAGEPRPRPSLTVGERSTAESLLPVDPRAAATWSAAVMELGALVCTARSPRCAACPVASMCAWAAAGYPDESESAARPRRSQRYEGTDRQARGRMLGHLRDASGPVVRDVLLQLWPGEHRGQAERALDSLQADGLVVYSHQAIGHGLANVTLVSLDEGHE